MKDCIDQIALSQRSKTHSSIWVEVRDAMRWKYVGVPLHMMKESEVLSRIDNQRHGGRRADRISDIEHPSLALLCNGMNMFLMFNTPLYDPASGITQHRVTGWAHCRCSL